MLSILGRAGPADYLRRLRERGVFDRLRTERSAVEVPADDAARLASSTGRRHPTARAAARTRGAGGLVARHDLDPGGPSAARSGRRVRAGGGRRDRRPTDRAGPQRADPGGAADPATAGSPRRQRGHPVLDGGALAAVDRTGGGDRDRPAARRRPAALGRGRRRSPTSRRRYGCTRARTRRSPWWPPPMPGSTCSSRAPDAGGLPRWIAGMLDRLTRRTGIDLRAAVAAPVAALADIGAARAEVDRVLDRPGSERVTTLAESRTSVLLGEIADLVAGQEQLRDPRLQALVDDDLTRDGSLVSSVGGVPGPLRRRPDCGVRPARPPEHAPLPDPPGRAGARHAAGRSGRTGCCSSCRSCAGGGRDSRPDSGPARRKSFTSGRDHGAASSGCGSERRKSFAREGHVPTESLPRWRRPSGRSQRGRGRPGDGALDL